MNKKTLYGAEARAKILEGVKKISAAVKVTLGPMGRNVLISQSMLIDYSFHALPIHVTKDGYTVAKSFDLMEDPFEKAGVLMIKEATQKTVDQAGDGTTTCCVLAEAIVIEGMKLIEGGANPMDIKRGIDKAVEYIVEQLKEMAVPIKGDIERIRQIATVSANNDPEIGEWIAKAFEKIGSEGVIDLEASRGVNTEIKLTDGYKWDNGWISPFFVSNKEKQVTEFADPFILLYEKRIIHHTQVQKALEFCISKGRPILIICEDAADEGLGFLAMNTIQGRIKCCVVKSPSYGNERRLDMEDIAILTGGTYISDTKGLDIAEIEMDNFGTAKKVIISRDETIIVGGDADKKAVEDLLNELRMNLAQAKNEEEKAPIEKRIAKLTGGIAVIQVGAATETEMKERLDRFDDAVRATKAAISEGYVPGAGSVFFRIILPKNVEADLQKGYDVISASLLNPFKQICTNAGKDPQVISDKLLGETKGVEWGYNARTDKIENLVESGIIDPVKVLRCALQNAASTASMMLTCDVVIADTL